MNKVLKSEMVECETITGVNEFLCQTPGLSSTVYTGGNQTYYLEDRGVVLNVEVTIYNRYRCHRVVYNKHAPASHE